MLQQAIDQARDLIVRNHHDIRDDILDLKAQLQQFVLRAVYEADQRAAERRMSQLEAQHDAHREELAGHHRQNRLLFWTVAGTVLGAVVTVVLTVLMVKGGSH